MLITTSVRNFLACVVAIVLATALVTFNEHQQMSQPPLQVNAQSSHSTDLRFPAVAICTNNVISKVSLEQYVEYLLSNGKHNREYGLENVTNFILNFGAFLSRTLPRVDPETSFKDPYFNVSKLMYKLSPKCRDLLKGCVWEGVERNCSDLFATRITPLGYCCVFNSRYQPWDRNASVWGSNQVGQNAGLIVWYAEDDEDSAYQRRPALGVEVLIFDGDEYPLLETGVARLYPVQRNASMFFALSQRLITTSHDMKYYTERWRRCRMRAVQGPRDADTSYGWCLLECRRRTIAALCNCVPFTLMSGAYDAACTPKHLPCLNKHKEKFIYYYPGEDAGPGLTEEMQDSLVCNECLPDCGRTVFSADVALSSISSVQERKFILGRPLREGISLANTSILRFYYNSYNQPLFLVEPAVRWYENIATLACHWVLLLTATLVTVVELVFHLTVRWAHYFWRRTILLKTQVKLDKSPTNSANFEDRPVACLEETTENIDPIDIREPPVKSFYF